MEETIKDAINYAPDLILKFIMELYDELDVDGKAVFRANLGFYFLDMGIDDEEEAKI